MPRPVRWSMRERLRCEPWRPFTQKHNPGPKTGRCFLSFFTKRRCFLSFFLLQTAEKGETATTVRVRRPPHRLAASPPVKKKERKRTTQERDGKAKGGHANRYFFHLLEVPALAHRSDFLAHALLLAPKTGLTASDSTALSNTTAGSFRLTLLHRPTSSHPPIIYAP